MTAYSYTYTLDELEMDLLRFLIQEYLKTATDKRRIELGSLWLSLGEPACDSK